MELEYPRCCGSEDGELFLVSDAVGSSLTVGAVWRCNTCGIISVVGSERTET